MTIEEFNEKRPAFIQQALEIGNKLLENNGHLDISITCVEQLDDVVAILQNLWKKKLIDDTVAWNSSVDYGVLLGEMIIKEHDYHWTIYEDGLPVVETPDNNKLFPITKMYKIITDEDDCEGTPSGFYSGFQALLAYDAMSEEEKAALTTYIGDEEPCN